MEYETGGRAFPRAIRHIYIGLFTWQLTMIGLFAVRGSTALGQLVLMIVTLVVSIFALVLYDKSFKPLFKYLPVDQNFVSEEEQVKDSNSASKLSSDLQRAPTKDDDKKGLVRVDAHPPKEDDASKKAGSSTQNQHQLEEEDDAKEQSCVDAYKARRIQLVKLERTKQEGREPTLSAAKTMYDTETYMHPSLCQLQPTVWLPQDRLGVTEKEIEELKSLKVSATSEGTNIETKKGGKAVVKVDKEILRGGKGMPGEQPRPGELSSVNDYVRVVVDSYNVVQALGMTSG